jgi:hypothetical protein
MSEQARSGGPQKAKMKTSWLVSCTHEFHYYRHPKGADLL